jgi:hypothetical protein
VAAHKQHSAPAAAGHRNFSLPALCSAIARAERARSYSYHVRDVQQRFRGIHMTDAGEKSIRCGQSALFEKSGCRNRTEPIPNIVNIDWLITEAAGYVQLGMPGEAEALLDQIPESEAAAYLAAQNILLQIYISKS